MKKCKLLAAVLAVLTVTANIPFTDVSAAAVTPRVASDTAASINRPQYDTYQFKFTVYGTHSKPSITVDNSRVLEVVKTTKAKDKKGDDLYYFQVKVVGQPGTSSAVYTKLPNRSAVKQCVIHSVKRVQIPYINLYAGFVNDSGHTLPHGDIVLSTKKDWVAFVKSHFSNATDMYCAYNTEFDFTKNSILYHCNPGAKSDFFDNAVPVDKIVMENKKPVLYTGEFGGKFKISMATGGNWQYVILVLVKKSDLAE